MKTNPLLLAGAALLLIAAPASANTAAAHPDDEEPCKDYRVVGLTCVACFATADAMDLTIAKHYYWFECTPTEAPQ